MIADQFLETSLWDLLWSRVLQSLKPEQDQANDNFSSNMNNDENSSNVGSSNEEPLDWTLISPHGYLCLLQLASRMLTISTQNCVTLILKDDYIMFDTLSYMLSDRFLNSIKQTYVIYTTFNCLRFLIELYDNLILNS